jgi:hypothetical protein
MLNQKQYIDRRLDSIKNKHVGSTTTDNLLLADNAFQLDGVADSLEGLSSFMLSREIPTDSVCDLSERIRAVAKDVRESADLIRTIGLGRYQCPLPAHSPGEAPPSPSR